MKLSNTDWLPTVWSAKAMEFRVETGLFLICSDRSGMCEVKVLSCVNATASTGRELVDNTSSCSDIKNQGCGTGQADQAVSCLTNNSKLLCYFALPPLTHKR